jgi:predicted metal-dependent hydrolase
VGSTDPELKSQVQGFIGQQVTHGSEHLPLTVEG